MIPARIIQTCKSEYLLSPVYRSCRQTVVTLHPDFEYLCFCDRDARHFIRERCPDYLELFDFYPRAVQKADLFRLLAVRELGGFYFDLDLHCYRNVYDLRTHRLVFPEEQELCEEEFARRFFRATRSREELSQIGNYAFAAEPGHWFLQCIVDEMIQRAGLLDVSNVTDEDILFSTGPDVLNATYQAHRDKFAPGELTILIGSPDPPDPKPPYRAKPTWHQFGTYGNHLINGSWRGGR